MMAPVKRKVFEAALCASRLVEVQVIPTEGLSLPAHVELPAMLHYGLDLPTPIPDLDITDAGIRATLSFSRTPLETFVPWSSVVAIVARGKETFVASWTPPAPQPVEPPRPRLRAVD